MPRSGERTQARLIRAGEKLFARHGIDATTITAITKEAGQRNNYAVGWHFGGKDELLATILDKHRSRIDDARAALLAEYEGVDVVPPEVLARAIVEPLADRLRDHPSGADYLRIQAHLAARDTIHIPEDRPPGVTRFLELAEPHAAALGADAEDQLFLLFVVVFHGLAGFAARNPEPSEADIERFTEQLICNVVAMMEAAFDRAAG